MKMTATSDHGLYKFTLIPSRLENSLATPMPAMTIIVVFIMFQFSLVYPEDIIILPATQHRDIGYLQLALRIFRKPG